jgi:hypothetical protein
LAARLPAQLEVSSLIRRAETANGFAAVLKKGERDAGTILLVLRETHANARLFERMPDLDGRRKWTCSRTEEIDNKQEFEDYLVRRGASDPDLWILELLIADGERFVRSLDLTG